MVAGRTVRSSRRRTGPRLAHRYADSLGVGLVVLQRVIAFVDLLLEDEEHDQAQQRGYGADKQQVGVVGRHTGGAGDGVAGERVGTEQAADDGDADGRGDVHSQIVHAHASAGFVLLDGAQHGGDDRGVHHAAAGVEHAGPHGQDHESGVHAERGAGPAYEHEGSCGHQAGLDADLADDHARARK